MKTEFKTLADRPTTTDLLHIRRQAEAMRAAYLRTLFRRIAAAFSRHGGQPTGGLTTAR